MLKKISLYVSIAFCIVVGSAHANANDDSEVLPIYPPRVQLIGESGKVYSKRKEVKGEFKVIILSVRKNGRSETGYAIPKSISEADQMLRRTLGDSLYVRLMNNYKDVVNGNILVDESLNERIGDLAIFFNEAWALKTNVYLVKDYRTRKDYVERFEGLLDSLKDYRENQGK